MAGDTTQWHLRERKPENPVVFFGKEAHIRLPGRVNVSCTIFESRLSLVANFVRQACDALSAMKL